MASVHFAAPAGSRLVVCVLIVHMWSNWKEVLCVGRQCDKHGRWFTVTPSDVRDALVNAKRLLARGFPVPAVWEHQDVEAGDAEAWKARYAKYTFAHIGDARINDRGNLDLRHDGRDPNDLQQLLKTKFVSPKLCRSYSDSRGGQYRGATIAHVAATPTPVQFWQRPFELSQGDALYLSYTRSDMADEADDKGEKKDKGGSEGGGEAGAKSGIKAVIDALREIGMNIPDEVNDEAGLVIAIKAGGGPAGGDTPDDDLDLDAPAAGDTSAPPGGPPMLMSTTDANPLAKAWAKDERREGLARIKNLFNTGRVTRPAARRLQQQLLATEMSFSETGDAAYPLARRLAELEKLAPNTAWKPTGVRAAGGTEMSATQAVGSPDALSTDRRAEEDAVIAEQAALAKKHSPKQGAAAAK